jgi:hypothetical protein
MELTEFVVSQGRIVVSKDDDFVQARLLGGCEMLEHYLTILLQVEE